MPWAPGFDLSASESASFSFILPNATSVSGRGLRFGPSSFLTVTLVMSAGGACPLGIPAGTLGPEVGDDCVLLIAVTEVFVAFFCGWVVTHPPHATASGMVNSQLEMRPCISSPRIRSRHGFVSARGHRERLTKNQLGQNSQMNVEAASAINSAVN